ncbi:MAG: amino acid-binding protein [Desulfobacteraceae bacterium 4572_130]|nr:MAG: amino acid-binding protein [Desulfobacteraceae bacterium 4572_130]
MIRTEISFFLKNAPGELGRLTGFLGKASINIDAMTIQDASAYVQNLFEARGKSLKRIASYASYNSVRKDSAKFALIRIIVDKPDDAVKLLKANDYIFDTQEVIAIHLENTPGKLSEIAKKIGEKGININYVYGSVASGDKAKCLFVFCPDDVASASKSFDILD